MVVSILQAAIFILQKRSLTFARMGNINSWYVRAGFDKVVVYLISRYFI